MSTHARAYVAAHDSAAGAKQYSERSPYADPRSFMELYISGVWLGTVRMAYQGYISITVMGFMNRSYVKL